MKRWWDRYPGLEQAELDSLQRVGIDFEKNPDAWAAGKLILHIKFPVELLNLDFSIGKDNLLLDAHYPGTYPFLKPEVFARDESFQRHQNPFEKNLCLIGRSTDNWESDWSIADYLISQLPKILQIDTDGAGSEFSDLNEEHQGEPFSEYLPFRKTGEVFFIDDIKRPDHIKHGTLEINITNSNPIRGMVSQLLDDNKNIIEEFPCRYSGESKKFIIPWIHLEKPLSTASPSDYISKIVESCPKYSPKPGKRFIGAVVFPEEGNWKNTTDAWVFIVAEPIKRQGKHRRKTTGKQTTTHTTYFVHSQNVNKSALQDRIPELNELSNKKILLFGLGSIGAPIALEMARGGIGEITLIDYDIAEIGPSVRWPFGIESSGLLKTKVLGDFIRNNYPNVIVNEEDWRIGDVSKDEISYMHEIAQNVDMIIDATAEHGVNHFLSDYASENKIPYIWAVGRPGGWGGIVGRIVPDKTEGCWLCYTHARLNNEILEPPSSPENLFQPTGCADPTFTGTSFDMTTIALTGVRMAIGTLCKEDDNGYPDIERDIISVAFRNNEGRAIPPTYSEDSITIHENCPCCSN